MLRYISGYKTKILGSYAMLYHLHRANKKSSHVSNDGYGVYLILGIDVQSPI